MIENETNEEIRKDYLKKTTYLGPTGLDLPPVTSTMRLYHATREEKDAKIELGSKRIFKVRDRLGNIWGLEDLEKKKEKILERIKNSNNAITQNKASGARLLEKIRESLANKFLLQERIFKSQADVIEYNNVIKEMEEFVNTYSVYEKFLQSVAQSGSEFNSVGDILNRFQTLELTRKECEQLLEEELKESSELRKEMVRLTEEKSTELKKLQNLLVELQVRRRVANERRRHWERCVRRLDGMVEAEGSERVMLVAGCWDMYRQMCQRRGLPITLTPNETEAQLDFIQKTIHFYKEVYTIASSAKQVQATPGDRKTSYVHQ